MPLVCYAQRWIFPEPDGVLGYPRQRVRRELEEGADFERANEIMASSAEDEAILAPHNRNSLVFKVGQTAAEEWAANALRTQNQVLDKLPPLTGESSMFTSLSVWLRMIQAAHAQTVLRKPSGMEAVRAWAPASSVSQRSALSTVRALAVQACRMVCVCMGLASPLCVKATSRPRACEAWRAFRERALRMHASETCA